MCLFNFLIIYPASQAAKQPAMPADYLASQPTNQHASTFVCIGYFTIN